MWRGRAIVALEANDLGAGKVVLEAQDVVHLGAAPAIDGLVVVAHAADVLQHAVKCWLDVLPLPAWGRGPG